MGSEPIADLIEFNLAISVGIVAVFLLRKVARAKLGAHAAYALWMLPPVAGLATFLPARVLVPSQLAADISGGVLPGPAGNPSVATWLPVLAMLAPWIWAGGAVAMLAWQVMRQLRFVSELDRGEAGPAVFGFFRPRVAVPADFRARYTLEERALIRQHEAVHLARHDARINAAVVLLQCVCWFNPLIHIAARAMRIDQEMSCDAAVVGRRPGHRRLYAEALLKTQLAASPLPVGCYWPAGTKHPLSERIIMLNQPQPARVKRLVAAAFVVTLSASGGVGSWWAQPAVAAPNPQQEQFGDFTGMTFDAGAPVLIKGTISRVEEGKGGYLLRVTDTASGKPWIVSGTASGGLDIKYMRSKVGSEVRIRGYQSADRACTPECRASGRDITFSSPQ